MLIFILDYQSVDLVSLPFRKNKLIFEKGKVHISSELARLRVSNESICRLNRCRSMDLFLFIRYIVCGFFPESYPLDGG